MRRVEIYVIYQRGSVIALAAKFVQAVIVVENGLIDTVIPKPSIDPAESTNSRSNPSGLIRRVTRQIAVLERYVCYLGGLG